MANLIFGQSLAIVFKMKKIIILIILGILSLISINQVVAIDYDQWCVPGVCWQQFGGSAPFYDKCTEKWGYCAGTGEVSGMYCNCRQGEVGYAGECSCDLNWNRADFIGPACAKAPNTWGICFLAQDENGVHIPCDSNEVCRTYNDGAYPDDYCVIDSTINCKIQENPVIEGCCYDSGEPLPTLIPTFTPVPTGYISPTPTPPPPSPTLNPSIPPPYAVTINLHFIQSSSASLSGDVCTGPTTPGYTDTTNINWGGYTQQNVGDSIFSFQLTGVYEDSVFTIQAWPASANFGCSCSNSPLAGEENRCLYADVGVPPRSNPNLDLYFYFDQANYPESWFQTFGASAFARNSITSIVPFATCAAETGKCQPAIFAPRPTLTSGLTSGFALLGNTNHLQLLSDENTGLSTRFQNLHWAGQRSPNQDAFGLGLNADSYSLSYNYFYTLADNASTIRGPLTQAQTNLATWRANGWINGGQVTNYFLVNESLTLDENDNFFVNNGESVVVFVNGNLTINNASGNDDTKITSVARKTATNGGGFLAFIVSGNIIINSNVGKTINPNQTSFIQPVTYANSHLEGVYVANGAITVNSQGNDGLNSSYPDRKLIAAGTFVGLTGINLNRRADNPADPNTIYYKIQNSYQALENFIYRADLLVNFPKELKSSVINWREVAPRSFNE